MTLQRQTFNLPSGKFVEVHNICYTHVGNNEERIYGLSLNSGAVRSVMGANQEGIYRKFTATSSRVVPFTTMYRLATSLAQSKVLTKLRLSLPDGVILDYQRGHAFITLQTITNFYTKLDLARIHLHFSTVPRTNCFTC